MKLRKRIRSAIKWLMPGIGIKRWLALLGAAMALLSLGFSFMLRGLYPLPRTFYYLTLQFIPRPVRGALFILTGVAVLGLALRSFRGMLPTALRWGKVKDK